MKTTRSSSTKGNVFQVRIKELKTKSLKGLLKEVHVLCPGKFRNSCERGSPCISMFKNTKKKLFFAFENNSLNPQRSSIIIWEQFDFKKKIKNSNYKKRRKLTYYTMCV